MHLSSRELNYLIWRYLQEEGLELSSHALDREASAAQAKGALVDAYSRGDLVKLVIKGLQLSAVEAEAAAAVKAGNKAASTPQPTVSASQAISSETPTAAPVAAAVANPSLATQGSIEPVKVLPSGSAVQFSGDTLALGTTDLDAVLYPAGGSEISLKYSAQSTPDANVTAIAWAPGAQTVAVGSFAGSTRIWTADGALLKALPTQNSAPVVTLKYNRDGSLLASVDVAGTLTVWDVAEGVPKHVSEQPDAVMLVEFEWIDERTFATTHPDGVPLGGVAVYKIGEPLPNVRFRGHIRAVSGLAFDQLSQLLASGGDDYVVNLWHARSPTPVRTLNHHHGPITALKWIPGPLGSALDGTKISSMLITASADGTACLWDLDATPPAAKWELDFNAAITLVEVNDAHTLLAVAGGDSVEIYRISPGEFTLVDRCAVSGTRALAWHDSTLAVATNSGTSLFNV